MAVSDEGQGCCQVMKEIKVVPYCESWVEKFESEKALLSQSIPVKNLLIHHIGSTSVVGLAAKPIIDILIEVENVEILDQYNEAFESIGYGCRGEFGIAGRRYFSKGGDSRSHQIHAFNINSLGAKRHIAFRDYLIAHKTVADDYAELKYRAAQECDNRIDVYCDIKNDFVVHHEQLAIKWAAER